MLRTRLELLVKDYILNSKCASKSFASITKGKPVCRCGLSCPSGQERPLLRFGLNRERKRVRWWGWSGSGRTWKRNWGLSAGLPCVVLDMLKSVGRIYALFCIKTNRTFNNSAYFFLLTCSNAPAVPHTLDTGCS